MILRMEQTIQMVRIISFVLSQVQFFGKVSVNVRLQKAVIEFFKGHFLLRSDIARHVPIDCSHARRLRPAKCIS